MANPQFDLPLPELDDFDMRAIDALPDLGTGMDFVADISEASALPGLAHGSDSTSATNAMVFNRSAVDPSLWQRAGPAASSFVSGSQGLSPAAPASALSVEQALLLNMSRTEAEMRKISHERDALREEVVRCQASLRAAQGEKAALEERLRQIEQVVTSLGKEAFTHALQHLKQAFLQAPIPRGVRFAPVDSELFQYLSRKLRSEPEEAGLDRLLVHRLRRVADCEGLVPEVDLLAFARPWHLPGLDMAPDSKGLIGYYFVRPEWRPNERRRRREADMSPTDVKPPCWKESCQPTVFADLAAELGFARPERRMFRFKLPGAREGPAGEKEKWKMYEYTLKSDAEMYEDRRMGVPVWVICKVLREGPMTREEEEETARRKREEGGGGYDGSSGDDSSGYEMKPGSSGAPFGGPSGAGFGRGPGTGPSGPGGWGGNGAALGPSYGYSRGLLASPMAAAPAAPHQREGDWRGLSGAPLAAGFSAGGSAGGPPAAVPATSAPTEGAVPPSSGLGFSGLGHRALTAGESRSPHGAAVVSRRPTSASTSPPKPHSRAAGTASTAECTAPRRSEERTEWRRSTEQGPWEAAQRVEEWLRGVPDSGQGAARPLGGAAAGPGSAAATAASAASGSPSPPLSRPVASSGVAAPSRPAAAAPAAAAAVAAAPPAGAVPSAAERQRSLLARISAAPPQGPAARVCPSAGGAGRAANPFSDTFLVQRNNAVAQAQAARRAGYEGAAVDDNRGLLSPRSPLYPFVRGHLQAAKREVERLVEDFFVARLQQQRGGSMSLSAIPLRRGAAERREEERGGSASGALRPARGTRPLPASYWEETRGQEEEEELGPEEEDGEEEGEPLLVESSEEGEGWEGEDGGKGVRGHVEGVKRDVKELAGELQAVALVKVAEREADVARSLKAPKGSEVASVADDVAMKLEEAADWLKGILPPDPLASGKQHSASETSVLAGGFHRLAGILRNLQQVVEAVSEVALADEQAALLWLDSLQLQAEALAPLARAANAIGQSRLLLILRRADMAGQLGGRAKALAKAAARLPRVVSEKMRREVQQVAGDIPHRLVDWAEAGAVAGWLQGKHGKGLQAEETLLALIHSLQGGKKVSGEEAQGGMDSDAPSRLLTEMQRLGVTAGSGKPGGGGLALPPSFSRQVLQVFVAEVEGPQTPAGAGVAAGGAAATAAAAASPRSPQEAASLSANEVLMREVLAVKSLRKAAGKADAGSPYASFLESGGSSNASLFDGALALLEACLAAEREREREEEKVAEKETSVRQEEGGGNVGAARAEEGEEGAEVSEVPFVPGPYRHFSLAEVEAATGARAGGLLPGEAAGVLLDGSAVTVEVLPPEDCDAAELAAEVAALCAVSHPHVVTPFGCAPDLPAVVHPCLPPVSLADFFPSSAAQGKSAPAAQGSRTGLLWPMRLRIAQQVASALAHLHSAPRPVVHKRVRPASIVLYDDVEGHLVPKLARFGMDLHLRASGLHDRENMAEAIYLDPEFARTDALTPASDVYSFGVVLIQLVTGRRASKALSTATAFAEGRRGLQEAVEEAAAGWPDEVAGRLLRLAVRCTDMQRSGRPEMREVERALGEEEGEGGGP